jgi:hypothetical protein
LSFVKEGERKKPKPNFFIVGAAKAGTTSLYSYLYYHPEVFLCPIKEPHFFSTDIRSDLFSKGYKKRTHLNIDAYLKRETLPRLHIAFVEKESQYLQLFRDAKEKKAIGECSTGYLYSKNAARNIASFNPESKIIMILRQPVERAFSHYLMDLRQGLEVDGNTFVEAFEKDSAKLKKEWGTSHLYRELGMYHAQVARYFEYFPKKNIKIFLFEDLLGDPRRVVRDICSFLGIDIGYADRCDVSNKGNPAAIPRFPVMQRIAVGFGVSNYFSLIFPMELKKKIKNLLFSKNKVNTFTHYDFHRLLRYFENDIYLLSKLIDRDLNHWLEYKRT